MIRKLKKYGVLSTKKTRIYWCSCAGNKNFGDILAEYLAKKITFNESLGCSKHCLRQYYAITGSILGLTGRNAIIWGSGIIRKNEKIRNIIGNENMNFEQAIEGMVGVSFIERNLQE